MSEHVDWTQVTRHLDDLYTASDALERMFPGKLTNSSRSLHDRISVV